MTPTTAPFLKLASSFTTRTQELCKRIEPETGTSVMHYDAAGNVDWSASAQNGLNDTIAMIGERADPRPGRRAPMTPAIACKRSMFPDINGSQSWSYTKDSLPEQVDTLNDDGNTTVTNTYSYNHRRLLTGETQIQPDVGALELGLCL